MTESPAPIGVLVVDDHPLLRDGLAALLGAHADLRLLGEAADGEEAIARYQQLQPDVVLMDLQMPRLDGVEAIVRIRALDPRARIIVLTTYRGDVRAVRALQAGASAYLLKDMLRHELVDTIRMVAGGRRAPIPPAVAASIAAHVVEDRLSPRETEVLRHVAGGLSNKRIGERMQISEQTVKAHMKSLMDKLGVGDRTHAVTQALRRGIISLDDSGHD
ncbi:DNA-binding response regulator [Stenotrophomonas maltophilia]|mgnify:FL=1|uniref:DNA-binding response regulator n=2 Tax=Gammaproteobacteria TaxID=1236 RepID=A0A246HX46_STEMA|nr:MULTISPECIES: response regulator transcription factor [Stenotrophomonas maltophilia group]CRQ85860.1 Response regulator protein VraR [Pseudomonas aeruginosa]MBA0273254.1 DNA-binding response regulator [Stenotrophomonas maltophilia]MBA0388831.1 DNA-binding response regulator [Stenotrophomonas maltophilia]MBA0392678.1 DNA-binding response regulator [Stenotrophomonas maltophilia]MBA0465696.1 DNA-binding response regulator [Stenotrophomonas maltophilia]